MTKRDTYHHGDLRRALIDATVDLLDETTIEGLSLRQVAKKAGVSHAAPYRHFEDKEALLAVVAEEGFLDFVSYLKQAVAAFPDDPLQQFSASGQAYVRYALEHPTHYRLMFAEFSLSNSQYEPLIRASNHSFEVLVGIIQLGQQQGVFRQGDPQLMAVAAWTQVHGMAMLLLSGRLGGKDQGEAAIASLSAALCQLMVDGFAAPNRTSV